MEPKLNQDQLRAVRLLATQKSFAVYGAAGTGKSVVRDYIARKVPCAVLGPTGMSMSGAGGMTVARFLRATPKTLRDCGAMSRSISRVPNVPHFTVIIDEAPMVATVEILALDQGLKRLRNSSQPFGGVRVVVLGDFAQLASPSATIPLFDTEPYKTLSPTVVVLKQQMRQSQDPEFARLLADCRLASISEASANLLMYELNAKAIPDDVVRLYATREETKAWTSKRLACLPGKELHGLKEGALVTVTKNFYKNKQLLLVNGSVGTVKSLAKDHAVVTVDGKLHKMMLPLPLQLAYALTIHKAQGQRPIYATTQSAYRARARTGYVGGYATFTGCKSKKIT